MGAPAPMAPPPAYAAAPPRKSSAMKWVLIGCGGLLLLALLCAGGCGLLGWYAYKQLQPIIEETQTFMKANNVIMEEMGKLDDNQGFTMTKFDIKNDTGRIEATLRGAKGSGTVVVNLRKRGDRWKIVDGTLTAPDGRQHALVGTAND